MTDFLDYQDVQEQAQTHAFKLAEREARKGFEYEYLFTYTDESGKPIYWKVRAKNHHTGEKWIRIFSSGERGFVIKEPDFKTLYPTGNGKKPLYALADIHNAPANAEIWLFEGEQKADLAIEIGIPKVTCQSRGQYYA